MLVRELAERLNCPAEGNLDLQITGARPAEQAGPSDLSFAMNAQLAQASPAGCLIVPASLAGGEGRTLLRAADPRATFAQALELLFPPRRPAPGVHSSAVVSPTAAIGAGVYIGPHVTIGENARIGENSIIGPGCTIAEGVTLGPDALLHARVSIYRDVRIGARVVIHSGAVIGADGFGFAPTVTGWRKFPQVGTVEIGDDVEIGANTAIDRAALGVTRVGNGVKLDNMVHIAHNCEIGDHVVIAAQTGMAGGCVVGERAVLGGQIGMGEKVRIEPGAIVGSGAGILNKKIVRKGEPYWGTPARPLKEYLEQLALIARLPRMRERLEALEKLREE